MGKDKWTLKIDFEADPDWKPMTEAACWFDCPLRCLTHLGTVCNAKESYDNDNLIICPIYRFGKKNNY